MTTKGLLFVIIQLFLLLIFTAIPGGFAAIFLWQVIAFIVVLTGIFIAASAVVQLGKNLTPMPVPKKSSILITNGIYKWVRHPVYSGIIVITSGISIYNMNIPRGLVTLLLLLLFYFKSVYEENLLTEKFPEYRNYKKTTGRFIPKLFSN